MSCSSRSLLFLLQRCVAVRQLTTTTRRTVSSGRYGVFRQPAWTSATRTVCLQRLCELQPAVRSSQHRFCSKAGEPYEDEYPSLPAYQPDSELESKDMYIVKVKGLPWTCTTQDILQFFSDCCICNGVEGIHLTVDKVGRPTGEAFIEMEHEEDIRKALEKHRQYLGPRYVEVSEVTNSDAEAILKTAGEATDESSVVLLRGLPYTSTENDISHFFSGLDVVENGITIIKDSRGRHSGRAFVQFTSQEAAEEALQRDRELIGTRYIEVFPSNSEKIHSRWRMATSSEASEGSPQSANRTVSASQANHKTVSSQSSDTSLHFIHMRGLPYQVSGDDIVKFFYPLTVSKILIECRPDGRPSGEADVYFRCYEDAMAAMSKDRMNIGHRYIELFLNSVEGEKR